MLNLARDGESDGDIKGPSSSNFSVSKQKRKDAKKHKNAIQKKAKVDSEDSGGSEKNSSLTGNDGPDQDLSESKQEPIQTEFREMSDDVDTGSADGQKVKAEMGESSEDEPNTGTQIGDPSTSVTQQPAANVRKKCVYGAKCYR
jgi:hypothetical protein